METRLVGKHWLPTALAALATAIELGADPDRAVAVAGDVEPDLGHLSVFEAPSGATFLNDVWKGSAHTVEPALDILDRADQGRRIAVLGFLNHGAPSDEQRYAEAIRAARGRADLVVLVGPAAEHGRDAVEDADGSIVAFGTVGEAAQFLRQTAGPGDLILLKSKSAFHLERVALAQTGDVTCERVICRLPINCARCRLLRA